MARPNKEGLDYFPLDVDVDDKIELLEAAHGITGFGVLLKLYQQIYKSGYYFKPTEERLLLFKKRINVDINTINNVINDCLRWGLFDKYLLDSFGILTSKGIQKRYIEATKKRKSVEFVKEFLLIDDVEKIYPQKINVVIYSVNSGNNQQAGGVSSDGNQAKKVNSEITGVSSGINSQSKVKESKVKNNNPQPHPKTPEPDIPPETPPPPSGNFKDLKSKLKNRHVVPMSKNNGKKLGEYFQAINQACDKITALPKKPKQFDPFKWAQQQVGKSQHPGAIMESLEGLAMFWDSTHDPWAYASNVLSKKNGMFNEQDAIAYHEELKNMKSSQLEFLTHGLLQEMPA